MGSDFDYGYEHGLWGADGIPYCIDIEEDVEEFNYLERLRSELRDNMRTKIIAFKTFEDASDYAKANPGIKIVRLENTCNYTIKNKYR